MYYVKLLSVYLLYEGKKVYSFLKQSQSMTFGTLMSSWKFGCTIIFYKLLIIFNLAPHICVLKKITRLCREAFIHVPLISSEKHKENEKEND